MPVYRVLTRSRSHLIRLYWISTRLWGHRDWYCSHWTPGYPCRWPGMILGGLWVMGGNHFPCLLNKTIKKHYELASGKAFACHCLHLFEGVSAFSCFFWLLQNKILHDEAMEMGVGGLRVMEGHQTLNSRELLSALTGNYFVFIGGVIDWNHIGADWCWLFLNLTHF